MNRPSVIFGSLLVLVGFGIQGRAQGDSREAEISALKKRVKELEHQNKAILKALEEIKSQLPQKDESPAATKSEPPRPAQASSAANKQEAVRWGDIVSGESRLKFYGFLRLDLITDESRPDNSQIPFFVLSEDPRGGGKEAANFTLHPRLSRIGMNFSGPAVEALGNSRLSGQFELDFQNGGRESRQIIRIRHANLKLTNGSFSLLAGQTWDVISPLFPTVNNDTLMWNAGNLGDRRPQITAAYEPKIGNGQFSVSAGLGLTGAIDALDLDNNGFRDGEESALPNVQARVGYAHASRVKGQKASFGLWGHRGWEKTTKPVVAGKREFRSQSAGLDFSWPFQDRITVRGEAWFGRNLSDIRGGISQGINLQTGASIRSCGGWAEANIKVNRLFTINPGFTIDDPRDEDLPPQARTRNRAWYLANRFNLGAGFLVGADYLRWITDYKGLLRGADNRFNLFMQYGF